MFPLLLLIYNVVEKKVQVTWLRFNILMLKRYAHEACLVYSSIWAYHFPNLVSNISLARKKMD